MLKQYNLLDRQMFLPAGGPVRSIRKFVFQWHFDRLQSSTKRRLPDYKTWSNDTAKGLGILPMQVEEEIDRPRRRDLLENNGKCGKVIEHLT
jgi:hypothetical protein